jgi:SAM-dependent methyltransferase
LRYFFLPIIWLFKPASAVWYFFYRQLDSAFRLFDDRRLQIVEHLKWIPPARFRTGGQSALSEYGYSAGVMAAYIAEHLTTPNPQVLDLGCGTGKMVSAVWPLLGDNGHYYGLDISQKAIDFNRGWYPAARCSFIHAGLYNAHYNPTGHPLHNYQIPLDTASLDLVVAFSLFTHLNQSDSACYFRQMARLLKPGGLAVLTFFLLDDRYQRTRHHGTRWDFDRTIEGQPEWHWASWFSVPERQIAVTRAGIDSLMADDFMLERIYPGWWAGQPAAALQDTLVFRRRS